jgi:uncharacterized membrane protein YdjX (TVP38/TMEM64 family)
MSWKNIAKAMGLLILLFLFFATAIQVDSSKIESWMRDAGVFAPILFSALMIAGIVISPIPTSPLTLMSARLFGVWGGMLLSLTSATIGAAIAFCLARRLGERFMARYPAYVGFRDILPKKATAWAIFLLRLPPSPTFDVISYAAGLTKVSLWQFIVATFLGMVPVVATLCFAGSVLPGVWLWLLVAAMFSFWVLRFWKERKRKVNHPDRFED